ncbi:hypothetical protein GCM10022211_19580 [Sphingomonas humi]|uniref:Uncharacterized protein n=1 Tax=Sphingomonas humi TaxID=335630 RepID=A0ABP7S4X7_9SPHN
MPGAAAAAAAAAGCSGSRLSARAQVPSGACFHGKAKEDGVELRLRPVFLCATQVAEGFARQDKRA